MDVCLYGILENQLSQVPGRGRFPRRRMSGLRRVRAGAVRRRRLRCPRRLTKHVLVLTVALAVVCVV